MAERKIKNIKQYLEEGEPQFNVLMRKEYDGESIYLETYMKSFNKDTSDSVEKTHTTTLYTDSETDTKSAIKAVVRILDDKVFFYKDNVELSKGNGTTYFIMEFKEDLVHCVIYDIEFLNPRTIEISEIVEFKYLIGVDEDESEEGDDKLEDRKTWKRV